MSLCDRFMSHRDFLSIARVLTVLSFCCLILVSLVGARGNSVVSTELDARLAIADAEQRIVVCYEAIANADRAGANTSTLLLTLNEAGESLSRAKLAYKIADFDTATNYGLAAQRKLDGFVAEADVLRGTALQQHYWDFMVNVVGSIVGTVVVICGSFVVWIILRKKA